MPFGNVRACNVSSLCSTFWRPAVPLGANPDLVLGGHAPNYDKESPYRLVPLDEPIDCKEGNAAAEDAYPEPHFGRLENGVQVIAVDRQGLCASLGLYVHTGSRFVGKERACLPHMLELMAFRGSAHLSHLRTQKTLEQLGAAAHESPESPATHGGFSGSAAVPQRLSSDESSPAELSQRFPAQADCTCRRWQRYPGYAPISPWIKSTTVNQSQSRNSCHLLIFDSIHVPSTSGRQGRVPEWSERKWTPGRSAVSFISATLTWLEEGPSTCTEVGLSPETADLHDHMLCFLAIRYRFQCMSTTQNFQPFHEGRSVRSTIAWRCLLAME
eukprot:Skav210818  [mRNA]  locus=scaffold1597:139237:163582:+ [translate_table: standard]